MLADPVLALPCPTVDYRATAGILADRVLVSQWTDLIDHAAEPNAFAEPWFAAASQHLPADHDRHMLVVRAGATLIALLPICIARRYGRLPVAHVQNALHHHSFLGTPAIHRGHVAAAWGAILDWLDTRPDMPGFLHLAGLVEDGPVHRGLVAAAAMRGRPCDTVHRIERALLASPLSPAAYYEQAVRKKKRKELKRLAVRLEESGAITRRHYGPADDLTEWSDAFLALEASGWKGAAGSALATDPATAAFFRAALAGADAAGRLDMRRIDRDGRAIAILVNFLTPPGAFSFKIAYDEAQARFSPGVLVQLDNLAILDRRDIAWSDSCAVEDHPMINSLWTGRRSVIRVSVPLAGPRRRAVFALCRRAERGAAAWRARRMPPPPSTGDNDG